MSELFNSMCNTVIENIYGYGKPDGSDYSDYLKKPASDSFNQIQENPDTTSLFDLALCWSMFEGVNIHNYTSSSCEEQKTLAQYIAKKSGITELTSDGIKHNVLLLDKIRESFKEECNDVDKVLHFVSYSMFASRTSYSNDNAYWTQVNLVILKDCYLNHLNALSKKFWTYPPTHFITTGNGPASLGPNEEYGPNFKKEEEGEYKGEYVSEFYMPVKDEYTCIGLTVKPVEPVITKEELCNWVTLDYIIKKSNFPDSTPVDRLLTNIQPQPYCKRGIKNLINKFFGNTSESSSVDAAVIFKDILFDRYGFEEKISDDNGLSAKYEFGSLEANPGIVYCLYKIYSSLDTSTVDTVFPKRSPGYLTDEYENFIKFENNSGYRSSFTEMASDFHTDRRESRIRELFDKTKKDESDAISKKMRIENYRLASLMYYFMMWDMACRLEPENDLSDENLTLFFADFTDLNERFYKPFTATDWTNQPSFDDRKRYSDKCMDCEWTNPDYILELYKSVYKTANINCELKVLQINPRSTDDNDKNIISHRMEYLRTILYNFGNLDSTSKDKMLNMMDYVGELKERCNLYCQPKSSRKLNKEEADDAIKELTDHHDTLKEIDCGFEINNYPQWGAPTPFNGKRRYFLYRNITCKFFSDTDKIYKYTHEIPEHQNRAPLKWEENYRITNKNNLTSHCLYVAERNTERHYVQQYSIQSILNESHPRNLLEAFYDTKEYIELTLSKKTRVNEFVLTYQLDFLNRHLKTFIEKYNLLKQDEKDDIWKAVYTNDKNVKQSILDALPEDLNYTRDFGQRYIDELLWFFNLQYCTDPIFLKTFYIPIAVYISYLGSSLLDLY